MPGRCAPRWRRQVQLESLAPRRKLLAQRDLPALQRDLLMSIALVARSLLLSLLLFSLPCSLQFYWLLCNIS